MELLLSKRNRLISFILFAIILLLAYHPAQSSESGDNNEKLLARLNQSIGYLEQYRFAQQFDVLYEKSDSLSSYFKEIGYTYGWAVMKLYTADILARDAKYARSAAFVEEVEENTEISKLPTEKYSSIFARIYLTKYQIASNENKDNDGLDYLITALDYAKKSNNMGMVGTIQIPIGYYYINKKEYSLSEKYFKELLETSDVPQHKMIAQSGLSAVYLNTEEYEKTIDVCIITLPTEEQSANKRNVLAQYNILLKALNYGNREILYTKALQKTKQPDIPSLLYKVEALADSVRVKEIRTTALQELVTLWIRQSDAEEAIRVYMKYLTFRDQLAENSKNSLQSEFDAKFKVQEAELENEKLASELSYNRKWWLASGLAALAMVTGLVLYLRLQRKSRKKLEIEKQKVDTANRQLLEMDEVKTRFFTNVSHELRTPLTLISGPLDQVLENSSGLNTTARNNVKLSLINAKKLHGRVNEILDLGKIEAGELSTDNSAVRIVPFVSRLVQAFESLVLLRGVSIVFNSLIDPSKGLLTDTTKLEKVVNNLLSNAVKFAPNNTDIVVRLTQENNKYSITVSDQGPGIADGEKEKIFDRYYQSKSGKIQGGTGIGLALSKELAKLLGGDIVLSATDSGTTFVFTFVALETESVEPLSASIEDEVDEISAFDVDKEFTKTPNVLVVEDNNDMRMYIKDLLGSKYNVYEAADGQKGCEILQTQQIDLITSDVMMPNRDGFEFLSQVKADSELRDIPFVMLTARAGEEDKLQALNENVDDYILKPFYPKELIARVNNLLVRHRDRKAVKPESSPSVTNELDVLVSDIKKLVVPRIADLELSPQEIADHFHSSLATLNRKLKGHIGLTCAAFLKEIRLSYAQKALKSKNYNTVKEVSTASGFSRPNYFAKEYYKRYGKKPSDYFG